MGISGIATIVWGERRTATTESDPSADPSWTCTPAGYSVGGRRCPDDLTWFYRFASKLSAPGDEAGLGSSRLGSCTTQMLALEYVALAPTDALREADAQGSTGQNEVATPRTG